MVNLLNANNKRLSKRHSINFFPVKTQQIRRVVFVFQQQNMPVTYYLSGLFKGIGGSK